MGHILPQHHKKSKNTWMLVCLGSFYLFGGGGVSVLCLFVFKTNALPPNSELD